MEKQTIWGYTHEEIIHRWSIWKRFDIVTRVFGTGEKEEKPSPTPVNSAETMTALAGLFGQSFMQPAS